MEAMTRPVEKSCHAFCVVSAGSDGMMVKIPAYENRLKDDDDEQDDGKSEVGRLGIRFAQRFPIVSSAFKRTHQAMKQRTEAMNIRVPNPPKTYSSHLQHKLQNMR
jgi:hypothetical protein